MFFPIVSPGKTALEYSLAMLSLTGFAFADHPSPPYSDRRVAPLQCPSYASIQNQSPELALRDGPFVVTVAMQPRTGRRRPPALAHWPGYEEAPEAFNTFCEHECGVVNGDAVRGSFVVRNPPRKVLISDRGQGVALIGLSGRRRSIVVPAHLVTIAREDGRIVRTLTETELLGREYVEGFRAGVNRRERFPWLLGALDSQAGALVIAAEAVAVDEQMTLRIVNLRDGAVRAGGYEDLARAITPLNGEQAGTALEIATTAGIKIGRDRLFAVFSESRLPLRTRTTAACLLAESGDTRGNDLILSLVNEAIRDTEAVSGIDERMRVLSKIADMVGYDERSDLYAAIATSVSHLSVVTGPEAMPILVRLSGRGRYFSELASMPVGSLGPRAILDLLSLCQASNDDEKLLWCVRSIGESGPGGACAVPGLVRILQDRKATSRDEIRSAVVGTLARIGPNASDAIGFLERLSADESDPVQEPAKAAILRMSAPATAKGGTKTKEQRKEQRGQRNKGVRVRRDKPDWNRE